MSDNINDQFQNTQESTIAQPVSVEDKARECLNKKYELMDMLESLTKSKQLSERCLKSTRERLSKTPNPQSMRVFSIIVLAIFSLCLFSLFSSVSGEKNLFLGVLLFTLPVYLVMVGLLAKSCKRSAALTWFNLLTFGIYGAILALSGFIRSFSVDVGSIEREVHHFSAQIRTLESEINATKRELQRIEDEINILSLTK